MGAPLDDLISVGATTFTNLDDAGNVRSGGEGDSCLQPGVRPPDGFPTVVIEAGYTQSWNSLRQKARWWFTVSHFDVKIVILVKFEHGTQRITIEKWKAVEAVHRPGMRTRAQANAPAQTAQCIQIIHITCCPGHNHANPASYDVTGPLHLEFVDVYLRQPIKNPGQHVHEGDIVIDIAQLQAYAVQCFRVMAN